MGATPIAKIMESFSFALADSSNLYREYRVRDVWNGSPLPCPHAGCLGKKQGDLSEGALAEVSVWESQGSFISCSSSRKSLLVYSLCRVGAPLRGSE